MRKLGPKNSQVLFSAITTGDKSMDDEELSLLNEFSEILQSEVYVDLDRLRNAARHGIPAQVRGVNL